MRKRACVTVAVALAACTSGEGARGALPPSGLETVFDSTGDTVVARVSGDVPASHIRHLVEELRIAPGANDTTLFTEVYEFDVDRRGRFWVFDLPTRSMFLFGADGVLERRIGRRGSGPGEFASNGGMTVLPDGRLALWDSQNARVTFLAVDGTFDSQWPHTAGFNTSNGLRSDTAGTLYVTRPIGEPGPEDSFWRLGLVRLGAGGVWLDSLDRPSLGVVTPQYVAEERTSGGGFNRNSTSVSYAPRALWTWHPHGYFVAAHGGRHEILLAKTTGRPVRIERVQPPVLATADERANEEEIILADMRQTDPAWTWRGAPVPETKAPLISVFAARDGRIWARVAVPSELIPDDERAVPHQRGYPVRRWRTPVVWEVFEPTGRFVARVQFPPRTTLMEADGDLVWGIQRDSLDLPALVRLRLDPPM